MPQGQGYTLDELKAMGKVSKDYQPPAQGAPTTERKGYTLQELQDMGKVSKSYVPPTPEPISAPEPSMGLGEKVLRGTSDLAIGVAKGVGSTLAGASALGEKILQAPIKAFGGQVQKPLGQEIQESGALEGTNTMQKAGKFIEQGAEFLLPMGAVNRGVKAVETASGLLKAGKAAPGIGKALGRLGVRTAAEAGQAAANTALQTGGDMEETAKAAKIGAVSVPAFGAVGKIAGAVGGVAMQALGKTTGAGEAALREAFTNPNVIKYARQGQDAVTSLQEQALEGAQRGLGAMAKKRGAEYVKELERIKADPLPMREITDMAIIRAKEALDNASVRVGKGRTLTLNAFKDSAIEQGKTSVAKAYRTLATWKDHTPAGLDRLKKKLTQFQNAVKNTTDGSYAVIKEMRNSVDDGLKANVPGYSKMTAKYRDASEMIDEIERALSLKDSVMKETAIRKLMSTMRQNNELRLDFLRTLGVKAGEDVTGKIAGATLAPIAPRGLAGTFSGPVSVGALTMGNIPGLLLYLSTASPRLVGEAISILGKSRGKMMTQEMKRALNALIIQATREKPEND